MNQTNRNVRRLVSNDLEIYFDCRLRALKASPTAFLSVYEEEKAQGADRFAKSLSHRGPERAIFGAFDGKKLVATVGVFREEPTRLNHKATIWGVHTDIDFRGRGIGRAVMTEAIGFAREEMKVRALMLSVETGNEPAKKLYSSLGFVRWGTEPLAMSYGGSFYEEDYMTLVF